MSTIDEIKSAIKNYHEILACKKRIPLVEERIEKELSNLAEGEKLVEKELQDVIKLQGPSIKYLFHLTLRNYKEQVKKENQEYLKATLDYQETFKIVELLQFELELLQSKIGNEDFIKKDLDRKLLNVEAQILKEHSSEMAQYKTLIEELNALLKIQMEIEEAQEMVLILKDCFDQLLNNLEMAKKYDGWGEFYAEKQLGKKLKLEFIDKADRQIILLEKTLASVKSELSDVTEIKEIFSRSQIMIRGFNVQYYESLIDDWLQDLDFSKTLSLSFQKRKAMDGLLVSLDKMKTNIQEEFELHDQQRASFLDRIMNSGRTSIN